MAEIPAIVAALASSVPQLGPLPPHPIAWKQTASGWVIIFEDGRKVTFENVSHLQEPAAPPTPPRPHDLPGKSRQKKDK